MIALRLALVAIAASNLLIGLSAALAPRSFYDEFPLGAGWVAELPPYNAHLTTDVGAFYLGFGLLFAWAAWRPRRALVVPLAFAWSLTSAIHLLYHVVNLGGFGLVDAIAQTIGLAVVLAVPLAALRYAVRPSERSDS
jgi:hypothetical protein